MVQTSLLAGHPSPSKAIQVKEKSSCKANDLWVCTEGWMDKVLKPECCALWEQSMDLVIRGAKRYIQNYFSFQIWPQKAQNISFVPDALWVYHMKCDATCHLLLWEWNRWNREMEGEERCISCQDSLSFRLWLLDAASNKMWLIRWCVLPWGCLGGDSEPRGQGVPSSLLYSRTKPPPGRCPSCGCPPPLLSLLLFSWCAQGDI